MLLLRQSGNSEYKQLGDDTKGLLVPLRCLDGYVIM